MASCNPKQAVCWHFVTPVVTPKMADSLGCNPVTPIPRREKERRGVTDRAQLVLYSIIHYTYVYNGNGVSMRRIFSLSYLFSGIGVTRLQPAEMLGFWGYVRGYKKGLLGVTKAGPWPGYASGSVRLRRRDDRL
jgi:hypothetical protein